MYAFMCVTFPIIGLVMGAVGVAGTRPAAEPVPEGRPLIQGR
jgi:hypothetical protein